MIYPNFIFLQMQLVQAHQKMELELVRRARGILSPEAFKEWYQERTNERRHKELCKSIEQAGTNARPSGIGIFW